MKQRVGDVLLWTVAFVSVAIVIAAGSLVVNWIVAGGSSEVWKAATALVVAGMAGGASVTALRNNHD